MMHFYPLLCFRPCSKPWHHWILLQSLTDIHICHTLSASPGQTKTHFQHGEDKLWTLLKADSRVILPGPPQNSQEKRGLTHCTILQIWHGLIQALPPRPSPACTNCSLPLRSWSLVILLHEGDFHHPFYRYHSLHMLELKLQCGLPKVHKTPL